MYMVPGRLAGILTWHQSTTAKWIIWIFLHSFHERIILELYSNESKGLSYSLRRCSPTQQVIECQTTLVFFRGFLVFSFLEFSTDSFHHDCDFSDQRFHHYISHRL
eukprot:TRINITY_DN584_c0_g1_i12.p1 TRINITY_DN584_c0_g1~~TRINITY_DN584_c0_g1_i12.p1  ORF type:complete len:106 (-),score=1.16 TRINITY_DN584_c0_g1_i12:1610-1927(-)